MSRTTLCAIPAPIINEVTGFNALTRFVISGPIAGTGGCAPKPASLKPQRRGKDAGAAAEASPVFSVIL